MTEKMNALRNKKGFTLIEMLVVIAIIAVLVAIVIPVVGNSTNKAACATNAANLRSVKAEVTTAFLTDDDDKYDFSGIEKDDGTLKNGTVTVKSGKGTLPKSKKTTEPSLAETEMTINFNATTREFTVLYGSYGIEHFVAGAEGETIPATTGAAG